MAFLAGSKGQNITLSIIICVYRDLPSHDTSLELNVIVQLELQLTYSDIAVQLVSHNTVVTSSVEFLIFIITFAYLIISSNDDLEQALNARENMGEHHNII